MFSSVQAFNQNLSSWNVSSSTNFVSFGQGIEFDVIFSLVWLCFKVGFRAKFITGTWLLKKHRHSTNLIFLVRKKCLMGQRPLIKTSVAGMSPVAPSL
jgi:hypothetical protein